ncbi:hypothetical protein GCM10027097_56280 [Amycolatopsis acidiphila]
MVRFGAKNTVSSRIGLPNRLPSGTGVIPCDSSARSPARVGIRPPNTSAVNAVLSMAITVSQDFPAIAATRDECGHTSCPLSLGGPARFVW